MVPPPPSGTQLLGSWLPAFDHPDHVCWPTQNAVALLEFNSIHASLIPIDPTRPSNPNGGKVLVWDTSSTLTSCASPAANGDYAQRYAFVTPSTQTVEMFQFLIPENEAPPAHTPAPNSAGRGFQGLFCSGHCWLRDGKLLVAGGDDWSFPSTPQNQGFVGSRLVCLFDPWATGSTPHWSVLRETAFPNPLVHTRVRRWYPTLIRLADDQDTVIIAGGIRRWDAIANWYEDTPIDYGSRTYEAIHTWDPLLSQQDFAVDRRAGILPLDATFPAGIPILGLFGGPSLTSGDTLHYYPRLHLTSKSSLGGQWTDGLAWSVAFPTEASWVDHPNAPNTWPLPHAYMPGVHSMHEEPSTVLMPNITDALQDMIVSIGGEQGLAHTQASITNEVLLLDTKPAVPAWQAGPPLYYPRKFHKTVILPDMSLLTLGGGQEPQHGGTGCEVFWPEVYRNGKWELCAKEESWGIPSPRTYHSSAVLLPSGEVLTCGGDTRHQGAANQDFDYQVFRPHYFDGSPTPPRWVSNPATIGYFDPLLPLQPQQHAFSFTVPALQSIASVVLISPGSWTHAQDPGQRCVNLTFQLDDDGLSGVFYGPTSKSQAPPGLYMLWLVSTAGIPSVATWVKLDV